MDRYCCVIYKNGVNKKAVRYSQQGLICCRLFLQHLQVSSHFFPARSCLLIITMPPDSLVTLNVLLNDTLSSILPSTPLPVAPSRPVGCPIGAWEPLNHVLFQLANAALLVSYLAPNGIYGILFLHSWLVIGK